MLSRVQSVVLKRPTEGVATLAIDRPKQRGALDRASLQTLISAFAELAADESLAAVVLGSTDPIAFCAGADVSEPLDPAGGVARMEEFAALYAAVESCPAVTICAMTGNTVGAGAELAAACDLRIAGDNLKLRWVGGLLGVPVGPARLAPLVGLAAARHLILQSPVVTAPRALELGLTYEVTAADATFTRATEIAAELASRPVANLRRVKGMFRDFEQTGRRVAAENELLVDFQRHEQGLPSGGSPR